MRSQSATSKGRGGRRYAPYVFSELERDTKERLGKHDEQLGDVFNALRQLISPPPRRKRKVGFVVPEDEA